MGVDPVTLTIGTAVLSGLSSVAGSVAQKRQAQYQAQVAQNNARIANANASYAARAGQQKEQSEAWKVRGLLGRQAAAQAASGLDINSFSPVAVRDSTAALGRLGINDVRDNAMRDYAAYKGQATNFMNEAALAKASEPTVLSSLLSAAQAVTGPLASMRSPAAAAPARAGGVAQTLASAVPRPSEALALSGAEQDDFHNPNNWVFI